MHSSFLNWNARCSSETSLQLSLLLNVSQPSELLLSSYSFGKLKQLVKMISSLLVGFCSSVITLPSTKFQAALGLSYSLEGFHLRASAWAINNFSRHLLLIVICLWVSSTGRFKCSSQSKMLMCEIVIQKEVSRELVLIFSITHALVCFLFFWEFSPIHQLLAVVRNDTELSLGPQQSKARTSWNC